MKKSSFLALAVAPMILGAPLAIQAQSVSTDPVGFVRTDLEPGLTAVGVNLVLPAVAAGMAESVTSDTINVANDVDVSSALDVNGRYYLEITSGNLEGDRLDIDVSATIASASNVLNLDLAAPHNTLDSAAGLSEGATFVVRPHVTFATVTSILGEDNLYTESLEVGDEILLFDNGFNIHRFIEDPDSGSKNWYDGDLNLVDNEVLAPGAGFMFRRVGTDSLELLALGEVRSNDFVLPLKAGSQLVALGFPVDSSPADLAMTPEFFTPAIGIDGVGDEILTYNNGFQIHRLLIEDSASFEGWVDGDLEDVTDLDIMEADSAVIVRLVESDPDFRVVKPY